MHDSRKLIVERTKTCAASIPIDGIASEHVGSSPLASHCLTVSGDAGSGDWKYSIPDHEGEMSGWDRDIRC